MKRCIIITQLRGAALVPSSGYPYIQFLNKDLTLCWTHWL